MLVAAGGTSAASAAACNIAGGIVEGAPHFMSSPPIGIAGVPPVTGVMPATDPVIPAAVGGLPAIGVVLCEPALTAVPPSPLQAHAKSSTPVAIQDSNCRFMKNRFCFRQ